MFVYFSDMKMKLKAINLNCSTFELSVSLDDPSSLQMREREMRSCIEVGEDGWLGVRLYCLASSEAVSFPHWRRSEHIVTEGDERAVVVIGFMKLLKPVNRLPESPGAAVQLNRIIRFVFALLKFVLSTGTYCCTLDKKGGDRLKKLPIQ